MFCSPKNSLHIGRIWKHRPGGAACMDGRKRWRQNEMARVKITFVYHSIHAECRGIVLFLKFSGLLWMVWTIEMISKRQCILPVFKFVQLVDEVYTLGVAFTYVGHCMLDINFKTLSQCQWSWWSTASSNCKNSVEDISPFKFCTTVGMALSFTKVTQVTNVSCIMLLFYHTYIDFLLCFKVKVQL